MIDSNLDARLDLYEIRRAVDIFHTNNYENLLKPFGHKATLVIGLTGCGKSTLCQLLAGNPDLKSENEVDSFDFLINDGSNAISESPITSRTYLPSVVPVPKKGVLIDFPGFLDTRSHTCEIATSVFIKKVMVHIKRLKILVVTNHHAVRKGVDRSEFLNLLNNLVEFIKSVNNYKSSIALVVNKVENQMNLATMQLVSDEDMLKQAVAFLREVRVELEASEQSSQRIDLLNIFMDHERGEYRNIGLLRRPAEAGLLTEVETFVKQKAKLEVLLDNHLSYSACDLVDFGMPLSEGAKLFVYKTEEKLRFSIQERLTAMCDAILGYYMKINEDHWTDVFPLLGPKRLMIKQLNQLINNIEAFDNDKFNVTKLFDWLHVQTYELTNVEQELLKFFRDYDYLANMVDTDRDDHKTFYAQLLSLRKALKGSR